MSCLDTAKVTGQHLLFLSTATMSWTTAQFKQAAQFAKAHGVDCLIVKAGDGANLWYGGIVNFLNIRDAIEAEGVGVIPYVYSYGSKYSALDAEIDNMIELIKYNGVVCADMEVEWNGDTASASHLCSRMNAERDPGNVFLVSTWSDPSLQNWTGVLKALNPCVSAYMPQQYNSYLGSFWAEFGQSGAACLQPTFDMTQDFGANDPVALAKAAYNQGHTAISIWYYETAVANPGLLDQIFSAFPKTVQEETMSIDITTPGVGQFFKASADDKTWQCTNGKIIGGAILDFYKSFGGSGLCGLSWLGLPLSNEQGVAGHPGVVYQRFERGVLVFDPSRLNDSPPGVTGQVYLAHIDSGIGQDPQIVALQSQVTALKTLPAAGNLATINTLVAQASTAIAVAGTAIAKIGPLSSVQ